MNGGLARRRAGAALLLLVFLLALAPTAQAQRIRLISDAEIENTIRTFGAPLFALAGLEPASVRVYIVNDHSLNAFVAGGQRIFLNTGLLLASDSANQVIGVIAHETGHLAGGHLAATQQALRNASAQSIIAMVLGAAAAVAGQGQVGQAVLAGGSSAATSGFLRYSRIQEGAADQAALGFLDQSGQSARGLLEFFEKLGDQEALLTESQDPYVRSHPLNRERIATVRAHVAASPLSDRPDTADNVERHARMIAKLRGFLSPHEALRIYKAQDQSLPARYARAIAHHKLRAGREAEAEIDALLAMRPDDAFFHELKGQMLLENGRVADAVPSYRRAVALAPEEILLRIGLAQALVNTETREGAREAVEVMETIIRHERDNPTAWHWLALGYARDERIGMAALATAERYMLTGRLREALGQANRALKLLEEGSAAHLRADDIRNAAEQAMKLQEERRENRN